MATVTPRGIVWTTTTGAKTTASFTPTAGELLVAIVGIATSDTAPAITDTDTSITGWTAVDTFRSQAATGGLRIYVSNQGASGSAITVTMTPTADAGGGLAVFSVTDPAAYGASAVRSAGGQADQTSGTTPAPVLSSTPLSKNPVIVAVMTNTNGTANAAVRTGYTEHYDLGFNTPPTGIEVQSRASGETSATLTTGATAPSIFASSAIEINTIATLTASAAISATAGVATTSRVSPFGVHGAEIVLDGDKLTGADNDPVASWSDRSGLGNHATQGTGGNQPTLQTAEINGLNAVLFDGVDDFLATALVNNNATRTIFVVARIVVAASADTIWSLGGTSARLSMAADGGGVYRLVEGGTTQNLGSLGAVTRVVTIRYSSTSSAAGYIDGGAAVTFDPDDSYQTGAQVMRLGAVGGGSAAGNVVIGALYVFDSALSDADLNIVRNGLAARWIPSAATHERSAAITATADVASSGEFFSVLEAAASFDAAAEIVSAGEVETPASEHERSAAIDAAAEIFSTGHGILERSASFDATAEIASAGHGVLERAAAIGAAADVASAGEVEAAGAFSPTDITGLYGWWDADALTLANNDPVSSWTDESGGGRHMTGAATPLYKTGIQNGKPGVLFDGTDDSLSTAIAADASRTVFIVAKKIGTADRVLATFNVSVSTAMLRAATAYYWQRDQAAAFPGLGGTPTSTSLISIVVSSASSVTVYLDGVAAATFDPNDSLTTGTTLRVGASNVPSLFWDGYVFEAIAYDSALVTADREDVEAYLTDKWFAAAPTVHERSASLNATAEVVSAATSFSVLERAASLDVAAGIASAGHGILERSASVGASATISSAAEFFTIVESSASITAAAGIASDGFADLARSASLGAAGAIAAAGQRDLLRAAVVGATATVATSGHRVLERSASLTATAQIAAAPQRDLLRQAAVGAAASIESSGEIAGALQRSASLTAIAGIASASQRALLRSASVGAVGLIASSGVSETPTVTHERSASISATGAVASAGTRVVGRSATVSAAAAITTAAMKEAIRSASLTATASITTAPQRVLLRSASLGAVGLIASSGDVQGPFVPTIELGTARIASYEKAVSMATDFSIARRAAEIMSAGRSADMTAAGGRTAVVNEAVRSADFEQDARAAEFESPDNVTASITDEWD